MPRSPKKRLDQALLDRGMANSLDVARSLIMAGDVVVNDQRVDKPGSLILESAEVRLKQSGPFVSRGGLKLEGAIQDFKLEGYFNQQIVLDVGASTGGFTECALKYGARQVIAVDVGTAQLDWLLRQNPKVLSIEKTDIKDLILPDGMTIDWVVADVSFTSLSKLAPSIAAVAPHAQILVLIKPQFELPRDRIPPGGIVTDDADRHRALQLVESAWIELNYEIMGWQEARLAGKQGNQEIFLYARPPGYLK